MSVRNILIFVSVPALLAACSTTKESPIYQQSTKYKVHSPYQTTTATTQHAGYTTATTQQAGYTSYPAATHQPVTYTNNTSAPVYHHATSSTGEVYTTQVNHECLDKEGDRKLIGTAVGGAAGALIGNQIGDNTTGTIIGGVAGAAAGYGIADMTVNCDPVQVATPAQVQAQAPAPVTYSQPYTQSTSTYGHTTTTTAPVTDYHTISETTQASTIVHDSTTTEQMVNAEAGQAPTDSAYGDTFGTPGYHAMIANGELDETTSASVALPQAPIMSAPIPVPTPVPAPAPTPAPSYPQYAYPQTSAPAPTYTAGSATTHRVVEGDTVYSLSRRLCVDVEDIRRLNSLNSEFYIRLDDYIKLPTSRC